MPAGPPAWKSVATSAAIRTKLSAGKAATPAASWCLPTTRNWAALGSTARTPPMVSPAPAASNVDSRHQLELKPVFLFGKRVSFLISSQRFDSRNITDLPFQHVMIIHDGSDHMSALLQQHASDDNPNISLHNDTRCIEW